MDWTESGTKRKVYFYLYVSVRFVSSHSFIHPGSHPSNSPERSCPITLTNGHIDIWVWLTLISKGCIFFDRAFSYLHNWLVMKVLIRNHNIFINYVIYFSFSLVAIIYWKYEKQKQYVLITIYLYICTILATRFGYLDVIVTWLFVVPV